MPENRENNFEIEYIAPHEKEPGDEIELYDEDFQLSPFFDLIENLNNFSDFDAYYRKLADSIDEASDSISLILEKHILKIPDEEAQKAVGEILREIREILEELTERIYIQQSMEGLDPLVDRIEELNEEYLFILKEFPEIMQEEEEVEGFLESVIDSIPQEEFLTENYLLIEEAAQKFSEKKIETSDFIKVLEKQRKILETSIEEYNNINIPADKLAPRVLSAHQLFVEGMEDWEKALNLLEESCLNKDMFKIFKGVDMAYQANRKLVIVQYINKFIDKR